MVRLEDAEFPSKYLNCYESVLITILKYMGLPEETPLMGTQAYFVFRQDTFSISYRFNHVDEEWERVHSLAVENSPVVDEVDLRDKITAKLDSGMPVCLPIDIYPLPHTPHYNRLHQDHYVDLFGYDDDRYYIVCPYYRFRGWLESELIHRGFFSPVVERKRLVFIPELKLEELSLERVHSLVRMNCQNMLGQTVPETLINVDPLHLGLAGIRTFSSLAQKMIIEGDTDLPLNLGLNLSRQLKWVGYSRYWFHRLVQNYKQFLLAVDKADELHDLFNDVVQSWQTIGVRLGAGVHGNHPEMITRAVLELERVYRHEVRLFNGLLAALPDYESGKL